MTSKTTYVTEIMISLDVITMIEKVSLFLLCPGLRSNMVINHTQGVAYNQIIFLLFFVLYQLDYLKLQIYARFMGIQS